MKYKKTISILTIIIAAISLVAAVGGIIPGRGVGSELIYRGQSISLYGRGLYQNDSVSVASQAIGQDMVTLILGIPLLLVSLFLARKGLLKGKLLLTGTLGYFLYTYASYSFLSMYNSFFLVYVGLMSASFFAFVLSMMSFDVQSLHLNFTQKMPVKVIGTMLIFIACIVGLMWMKVIIPPLLEGTFPIELEQYTTLTIQAMDLGFVVPSAIFAGVLLIKRKSFGYLLATVMTIKEATLLTAIVAMIIVQIASGIKVAAFMIIAFGLFDLAMLSCLVVILMNVKQENCV
jgi:hypothetical protein